MTQPTRLSLFNVLSQEKVAALYFKLRDIPYFFDQRRKNDPYWFATMLAARDSMSVEVGDFQGVFYATGVEPGGNAWVSVCMWDDAVKGATGKSLAIQAAEACMQAKKLHRLTVWVMAANKRAINFSKSIGFELEGTIREATWYNDKWVDVAILGVLRDTIESKYKELDTVDEQPIQGTGISTPASTPAVT